MASKTLSYLSIFFCIFFFLEPLADGQLDYNFYDNSCPHLPMMVRWGVWAALKKDSRMAASLLRLHFHDCFGCDASVLLEDTPHFKGEKNALPSNSSLRGFEVIDSIKADVERACPSIVSCADILTLAAREAVFLSGGPSWPVALGRQDALTPSYEPPNNHLPEPFEPLDKIVAKFAAYGLDLRDVVVLSGAHTFGFAQCFTFKGRLFNFKGSGKPDPLMDPSMVASLQSTCPNIDESNNRLVPLDVQTAYKFDNAYYRNLMTNSGLLESDQALMGDPKTAEMVNSYSMYPYIYYRDFAASMEKLGNIGVLTGQAGQIRKKLAL